MCSRDICRCFSPLSPNSQPAILKLPRGTSRRILRILINQRFFRFISLSYLSLFLQFERPFFVSNSSALFLLHSEKNDPIHPSISQARFPVRKFITIIIRSKRTYFPFSRRGSHRIIPDDDPPGLNQDLRHVVAVNSSSKRASNRGEDGWQSTMHTRRYTSRVARWLLCAGVSRRISCHFHRLIEHTIESRLLSLGGFNRGNQASGF